MTKVNMIIICSLILQSFVGSVYSTRTDSTFDQLKETAYNSFGTVKDFAGNSMETIKDTAGDAMGTVKNTVWWSSAPSNAPSDAPANAPLHGHHHGPKHHGHHHKFHADSPTPVSADDSAGSMDDVKQVHKVTMHTSMHDTWHGILPGNKAYNDVTGDPKYWGKGFAEAHQHHHKGASPPKRSTLQERILRESYKMQPHAYSPAPTNAASPGHKKAHDGSGKKIHTTIHTASHKFNDVTGDATATFHDWAKDGHGKGAAVPKSSHKHNRGLGESHNGKQHHAPSSAPTTPTHAAGRNHQIGRDIHKPAKGAQSPSPMSNGVKGKIHNTIHTSMKGIEKSILPNTANHKFNDVTGDATATFHDWTNGHGKGASVPTSSAKHKRGLSESHHGKATSGKHFHSPSAAPTVAADHSHQKHKSHANSPSPVTSGYADAILHSTIHTAVNHKFDDVTGDATTTFHDWAKDGHVKGAPSPKSSTAHRHVHVQGHGRGLSGSQGKHPHPPSAAPTIAAGPQHHGAPKSQSHMSNGEYSDPVVHDGSQKRIHVTIHTAANTAHSQFNDVTGDAASTLRHWAKDGHGSKGTQYHSPKHAPATHHGSPVTHERHLRETIPRHTPSHSGGHSHPGHPASAPATTPSPASTNGQHKAHKGTVHLAVNDNYNTAQATYNDVTGDDVAAYNDWESHRSHGNHQ